MNRKLLILLSVFTLLAGSVLAQSKADYIRLGDQAYAQKNYYAAATFYEKLFDKYSYDSTFVKYPYSHSNGEGASKYLNQYYGTMYKLAESYRLYNDFRNAEKWYRKVFILASPEFPMVSFWYGTSLRANRKFEEAIQQFRLFDADSAKRDKNDVYNVLVVREIANCKFAANAMKRPKNYTVVQLLDTNVINVSGNTFAATVNGSDTSIMFTSSRSSSEGKMLVSKRTVATKMLKDTSNQLVSDSASLGAQPAIIQNETILLSQDTIRVNDSTQRVIAVDTLILSPILDEPVKTEKPTKKKRERKKREEKKDGAFIIEAPDFDNALASNGDFFIPYVASNLVTKSDTIEDEKDAKKKGKDKKSAKVDDKKKDAKKKDAGKKDTGKKGKATIDDLGKSEPKKGDKKKADDKKAVDKKADVKAEAKKGDKKKDKKGKETKAEDNAAVTAQPAEPTATDTIKIESAPVLSKDEIKAAKKAQDIAKKAEEKKKKDEAKLKKEEEKKAKAEAKKAKANQPEITATDTLKMQQSVVSQVQTTTVESIQPQFASDTTAKVSGTEAPKKAKKEKKKAKESKKAETAEIPMGAPVPVPVPVPASVVVPETFEGQAVLAPGYPGAAPAPTPTSSATSENGAKAGIPVDTTITYKLRPSDADKIKDNSATAVTDTSNVVPVVLYTEPAIDEQNVDARTARGRKRARYQYESIESGANDAAQVRSSSNWNPFRKKSVQADERQNRLYYGTYADSMWKYPDPVVFANGSQPLGPDMHYGTPSISSDGQNLYFTSGSTTPLGRTFGIYRSKMQANKQWSVPEKLNDKINIEGSNSMHPYISEDGKILYYSSDRPDGVGKLDIWYAKLDSTGTPYESTNMGYMVNTPEDEVSPYYNEANKILYFATNGRIGMGGLDIFKIRGVIDGWSEAQNAGFPINSSKDDAFMTLVNNDTTKGYFSSDRASICCYELYSFKEDRSRILLEGYVRDADDDTPISNVQLTLIDTQLDTNVRVYTDTNGYYYFFVAPNKLYKIIASKDGVLSDSRLINTTGIADKTNILKNFVLNKLILDRPIVIKNIYYDFNKATIRSESEGVLDSLANFLQENPNVIVEIGSHTDNVGTDKYNIRLSNNRSAAVVSYLIRKGVSRELLTSRGYGESRPVAPNTNPDGTDNPDGRQLNRRTEFKVLKIILPYSN